MVSQCKIFQLLPMVHLRLTTIPDRLEQSSTWPDNTTLLLLGLLGLPGTAQYLYTGPGTAQYLFVWHVKSCRPGYHAAKAYRFVHLNNTSVGELVRQ